MTAKVQWGVKQVIPQVHVFIILVTTSQVDVFVPDQSSSKFRPCWPFWEGEMTTKEHWGVKKVIPQIHRMHLNVPDES